MCSRWLWTFALATATGLSPAAQAPSPVTSAKLHITRRTVAELVVQITNHRTSPLEQYAVRISSPRGGGIANWRRSPWPHTGEQPIAQGETRELRVSNQAPEQATAAVILANFADGYYEGDEEFLRDTFAARARRADDLRYWIAAITAMPDGSNEATARYIRAAAERQPGTTAQSRSEIAGQLALDYVERPPGWIAQVVRRRGSELREELATETRHLTRMAEVGISSVQVREGHSVSVRLHPAPGVQIMASIENQGQVPLDAWAIGEYSELGLLYVTQSTDTCSTSQDVPGRGIQPGETRELGVLRRLDVNDPVTPRVALVMALFRDGRFEGAPEERDRLLAARAARSCR